MSHQNDIVVVGAGVAGALVAWSLARRGLAVTLVEAGPDIDRSVALEKFRHAAIRVPESPYPNSAHADRPATIQDQYLRQEGPDPMRSTFLRQVGGTTWHWLGTALRLLPSDFELHSRHGVGIDWPLSYADLAPWYDLAENELGVSGQREQMYGAARSQPYAMPGLPPALGDTLLQRVANAAGFEVRVSPQARNSVAYDGRPACCGSATCIPICPIQAKYDGTVHVRKAVAAGARLLTDSVAVRIEAAANGKITGLRLRRPDGSESLLATRQLVIAANAIEGPKLLLMSQSERFTRGIANRSDAVGRYLMDHPVQLTRALAPVPVWQRRGPQEVSSLHELRDGTHRDEHGAMLINIGNQGWEWAGPNLAALSQQYIDAGLSGLPLLQAVRDHASREMTLVALTEQLPQRDNRVQPDYTRLDGIGIPKPRIFFRLDDYTQRALARARTVHDGLFTALGATEIGHLPYAEGAGHIMGTTRMGHDPATSVADGQGRSHDHENLWFAGASLFPTVGAANPTLTIAALALRTSAAIAQAMQA